MLSETLQHLASQYGLERIGFLTLTFAHHVTDLREAQRYWHSLRTNVMAKRYLHFVRVIERTKAGRIHLHIVTVHKEDIRTGANFEEFANKNYKSANDALRAEWSFWRKTTKLYHFGRHELFPVKTNVEAMARYVGKYISKHIHLRLADDKGKRLVSYSRAAKIGTTNFAWCSPKSWLWRAKLAGWALAGGCQSLEQVASLYGPRWAWHHRDQIMAYPLTFYPTLAHAAADGRSVIGLPDEAIDLYWPAAVLWDEASSSWAVPATQETVSRDSRASECAASPPDRLPGEGASGGTETQHAPEASTPAAMGRRYLLRKMHVPPTQKRLSL